MGQNYAIILLLVVSVFAATQTKRASLVIYGDDSLSIGRTPGVATADSVLCRDSGEGTVKACPFPSGDLGLSDVSQYLVLFDRGDSLYGDCFYAYLNGQLRLYGPSDYTASFFIMDSIRHSTEPIESAYFIWTSKSRHAQAVLT